MVYLDYSTYVKLGGTVEASVFPNLLKKSMRVLDYFTQSRIKDISAVTDEIKECLTEMINNLDISQGEKISSFSNDGISVNFDTTISDEEKLYNIVRMYLPIELLHTGVD